MAPHALASQVSGDVLKISNLFNVDGWVILVREKLMRDTLATSLS